MDDQALVEGSVVFKDEDDPTTKTESVTAQCITNAIKSKGRTCSPGQTQSDEGSPRSSVLIPDPETLAANALQRAAPCARCKQIPLHFCSALITGFCSSDFKHAASLRTQLHQNADQQRLLALPAFLEHLLHCIKWCCWSQR